ncbi:MAG: hypothetical protein U5K55_02920 [Aliarcobacter sp.]|nr:hypothetical protein [Aliarcobacter sp.]
MKSNLVLFFIISNLFASDADLIELKRKKDALINEYSLRIFEAEQEKLEYRVLLLNNTLKCFVTSKSKRDITNCKIVERKLLMDLIRG